MEFKQIEHYDVMEGDVIIFWADISGPPQKVQNIAREIDGCDFNPESFGICVNYSFAEKEFYLVTDTEHIGETDGDNRNIFYTDQNGDKHWFKADIPQELLDHVFEECGKIVSEREKADGRYEYRSPDVPTAGQKTKSCSGRGTKKSRPKRQDR